MTSMGIITRNHRNSNNAPDKLITRVIAIISSNAEQGDSKTRPRVG